MKMKKNLITMAFAMLGLVTFITGCEEEPPGVIFKEVEKPLLDTTYTGPVPSVQLKNILLVDITGVNCNNCPDAAVSAKNILGLHPGRVNLMAMYPYIFKPHNLTNPFAGYDTMNSDDADYYINSLGSLLGLPNGLVDQVKQNSSYFIPVNAWTGLVDTRLSITPPVNIDLKGKWLSSENKSRLEIKLTYSQTLDTTVKHRMHIALVESGIIGKQANKDTAGGIQYFYHFDHIFRKLLTPVTGVLLNAPYTAGRVFEKHYYITPRYNWKPDNLVALVWVTDAADKQVLQSYEVPLK
jgi:hypothetical protein